MTNTINSMYAQLVYMLGIGFGLLLIPNTILSIFSVLPSNDGWIRVIGALALALVIEYYTMIKQQNTAFFMGTVWGRYLFCGVLALLVALGYLEKPVYLFAILEAGLAVWTHLSLKKLT
jgi:hypothetical protein